MSVASDGRPVRRSRLLHQWCSGWSCTTWTLIYYTKRWLSVNMRAVYRVWWCIYTASIMAGFIWLHSRRKQATYWLIFELGGMRWVTWYTLIGFLCKSIRTRAWISESSGVQVSTSCSRITSHVTIRIGCWLMTYATALPWMTSITKARSRCRLLPWF